MDGLRYFEKHRSSQYQCMTLPSESVDDLKKTVEMSCGAVRRAHGVFMPGVYLDAAWCQAQANNVMSAP